jgi:hypothetical protein
MRDKGGATVKALIVAVVVMAVAAGVAPAQTDVSGEISTSTTWNVAGSPYIIQGLTEVTNGSTLSIEPGVTVAFNGFYILRAMGGSSIYAEGTQSDRILFTSNSGTPAPDDWIWIYVEDSASSHFAYCDIEYGRKGLFFLRSQLTVANCTVRYVDQEGIICQDCSPTIQSCDISGATHGIAVVSYDVTASPVVHGCNIYDNFPYNMSVGGFADPPVVTIDATDNWWGTNVEAEIEATIDHDVDDPSVHAHVDFDPWLMDTPVEETTWASIKMLFVD